jgi:hypothetical protein
MKLAQECNMRMSYVLFVLPLLLIAGCKDGSWLSLPPEEIFANPSTVALVRDACSGALHKSPLEQSRRGLLEDQGVHGLTPLFSVMALNCVAGFEDLLKSGANPNHGFEDGATILHFASWGADPIYVVISLKYNADPNSQDLDGRRPLHWLGTSVRKDYIETAQLLVRGGANLNALGDYGTPMMDAAKIHKFDLVYWLLNSGANPNLQDKYGKKLRDYVEFAPLMPKRPEQKIWYEKVRERLGLAVE